MYLSDLDLTDKKYFLELAYYVSTCDNELHLEEINFDLYEMAENAVDMIALEAHKRGLETAIFINSDVPVLLKSDPIRIRQIIVNLFNKRALSTQIIK